MKDNPYATHACNCVGPRPGEPKCPCLMRNVIQRNGRWVETEKDLGPVRPSMVPANKCPVCKQGYWSAKFCPECGTNLEPLTDAESKKFLNRNK